MRLHLRPALEADLAFCESLYRLNMASYLSARGIAWDPDRYQASWAEFENFVILVDDQPAGLLRLLVVDGAIEIRDLQVVRKHQGLGAGSWAIAQAKSKAVSRGIGELRLRVFADNPAKLLYTRLAFKIDTIDDDVVHMSHALPSNDSFKQQLLGGSA